LSAYVLLGMPFGLGGILTLMSRDYMMPMFTTTIGHFMIGFTMVIMTLGYVICMKIVNFKT
jgi:tight adherence protein B